MARWLWWAPFGLLVVLAALLGLRFGWVSLMLTETDVIEAQAARYLLAEGDGAERTDCQAEPGGHPLIWLTVECGQAGATARYRYHVHPLGGLLSWERYVPNQKGPLL